MNKKGFSRYDKNGNVTYSENVTSVGKTVRHFYEYDDLGRRIVYKQIDDKSILLETTTYSNNGGKIVNIIIGVPDENDNVKYTNESRQFMYNPMGRIVQKNELHCVSDGVISTTMTFDDVNNRFNVDKTFIPFIENKK